MNNVNLEKIKEFVQAVEKDPTEAKKHKIVNGSWVFEEGKPQFTAMLEYQNGKVSLNCEMPPFAGGWGTSPDPIQYCLYGLAACFAVTFAATASSEGIQLKKLEVTAENWIDLKKQIGLSKDPIIERIKLTVRAEGASREVLERLLKISEERCPGVECVTRSIPFETVLG
ncbi:MAG: OsmC family protein [Aigarchaeota archaeon]|nr:OsmC family protein [Candidatus Pelearchaeum maunauluense]